MHAHRPRRFLGKLLAGPLLLALLDTAMLDQTALIIVVEGLQRVVRRDIGQDSRFASWSIVLTIPVAHHHRMDGVGLKVSAVVVRRMLCCSLEFISIKPSVAMG